MNNALVTLLALTCVMAGGAEIYLAIKHFEGKKYFCFGTAIMWTVAAIAFLIKLIFTN